jgi:hypothetical protein
VHFTSAITSKVVTQSFFSQDISNIKISNRTFETEIVRLFEENIAIVSTVKFQLKKMFFGQWFADNFLF